MPAEEQLRSEIVRVGRWLHENGYVDAASGNISARLDPERLLATPSGLPKGFLEPDQLIIVNMRGELISGAPGLKPTSELRMHLEAYRRRPDVNAVVHAHPITSIALSIAGISLAECVIPEAIMILGLIPTTPYATPSSEENRRAISEVIVSHDAIILQYHGSLTVGRDVMQAYMRLETLEHTAKIIALSKMLGGVPTLPPEQVTKLIQMRRDLGYGRPGDDEDFCVACGVCHPTGKHASATPHAMNDVPANAEEELVREIAERVRRELAKPQA